ncbi:MAG: type II secretion system protein GspM [Acetobacteraceae bacterium]
MNAALFAPLRRVAAIALLFVVPLLIWLLIVGPLIGMVTARQDDIVTLSDRAARLQALISRIPGLKKRNEALKAQLESEGGIWIAASEAAVSAHMEEIVRRTVGEAHGSVKSASQLRGDTTQDLQTVRVRFNIDGSLDAVERTLAVIDRTRPAMFVDTFMITAPANPPVDRPPTLNLDLEVMGYMRKSGE